MKNSERTKPDRVQAERPSRAKRQRRASRNAPDFATLLDADNALDDTEYTGDLQGDADAEMSDVLKTILEQRKNDRERYRVLYDKDYYFVVCFQSAQQRDEFQQTAQWPVLDKFYVDGVTLADNLNVPITVIDLIPPKHKRKRKFRAEEVLSDG